MGLGWGTVPKKIETILDFAVSQLLSLRGGCLGVDHFLSLRTGEPELLPRQDVKTRAPCPDRVAQLVGTRLDKEH